MLSLTVLPGEEKLREGRGYHTNCNTCKGELFIMRTQMGNNTLFCCIAIVIDAKQTANYTNTKCCSYTHHRLQICGIRGMLESKYMHVSVY